MTSQLFPVHTNEEQTQSLANLLPSGRVFASKNLNDSNFRQYLRIFAPEMSRFENELLQISREHDINDATFYLTNWEKALGIPDECFPGSGTLEERRLHCIIKLACMNVSTEQDMIDLALKLGYEITIEPLIENIFPPYEIPMLPIGFPAAKFVWIIRGEGIATEFPPYEIPHFLEVGAIIITCVLDQVKPAFIKLLYLNPGDDVAKFDSGFDDGFDDGFF